MNFSLNIGQILIIAFLFLTSINCLVTYLCSSSSLKELEETASFPKAINKIRVYDKYLLTILTLITSTIYVILSYLYFVDLLVVSDYFITLSVSMGFVLSLFTTFFSRLCYCYACNVLLKTKLSEYECFMENFFYLLRIFFPIFLISFVIPTIYVLPIKEQYRNLSVVLFIAIYLLIWVFSSPFKTILTLNARKMKNEELVALFDGLFKENEVKRYKLYYWDSSKSNEANALVSGFYTYYLFISSTLIESINKRELQAVVLHEIGHIKNHHFTKILVSKLVLLSVISIILYYTITSNKTNIWVLFGLVFAFILIMGMNLKGSKKYEDEADFYVNSKGFGLDLISALKKISFEDNSINKLDEFFSSHPNVNKRIDRLDDKQIKYKVLCLGFNGKNNASYVLVDKLTNKHYDKKYLTNSFDKSVEEFNKIEKEYDRIIIFGVNKDLKNEIVIEKKAKVNKEIETQIDVEEIKERLENNKIRVRINDKATNYLCNNIYYNALLKNKNAFLVHIPGLTKIEDMEFLVKLIDSLY